jgi:hypothetical protein
MISLSPFDCSATRNESVVFLIKVTLSILLR